MTETKALPVLKALPAVPNPVASLTKDQQIKLADDILAHYEQGAQMQEIGEQLGIARSTVFKLVVKHRQDEWRQLSEARYHGLIEDAQRKLESASDALETTRAREQLANARWFLERMNRRLYGQQAPDAPPPVAIQINFSRDAAPQQVEITQEPLSSSAQVIDK